MKTCECCGHSMKMMQFANETKKRLTCPDCGWRLPTRHSCEIHKVSHTRCSRVAVTTRRTSKGKLVKLCAQCNAWCPM